jgi:hypothetical protein
MPGDGPFQNNENLPGQKGRKGLNLTMACTRRRCAAQVKPDRWMDKHSETHRFEQNQ